MAEVVQIKKRKRKPNWVDMEKCLLQECLKDKLDIIENKCTDTNTNKSKEKAWENVWQCFNELNSKARTLIELKQQWRTMKFDAKKKCNSTFKRELKATGGGAKEMVGEIESRKIIIEDNIISQECQTPKNKEISYCNKPKLIKTSTINESSKRNQKIKYEDMPLSESKRDAVTISFLQEEHDLKMKHLAEIYSCTQKEHELKMKNLILKNMILEKQLCVKSEII